MTFYGNGVVWDREREKPLCKFENGKIETDDIRAINILKERYKYEAEKEILVETEEEEVNPLKCSHCGFIAKNLSGLMAHSKKHEKED